MALCISDVVDVFPLKASGGRIEVYSGDDHEMLVWRNGKDERKGIHKLQYPLQSAIIESPRGGSIVYLTGSQSAGTWPVVINLKADGFPVTSPLGKAEGEGAYAILDDARSAKVTKWSDTFSVNHVYCRIAGWAENGDLLVRVTGDGELQDFGVRIPTDGGKLRFLSSDAIPKEDLGGLSVVTAFTTYAGSGTGFFVSNDGLIATALHVVDKAARVRIDYGGKSYEAKGAGYSRADDIHLLKIATVEPTPFLRLARKNSYRLGEKCFTIGYPLTSIQGFTQKFTEGSISGLSGIDDVASGLQISVPVQAGNSGGPLISEAGGVLGVIQARLSNSATLKATGDLPQNVNYAIKTDPLQKLLRDAGKPVEEQVGKLPRDEAIASAQAATVRVIVYR